MMRSSGMAKPRQGRQMIAHGVSRGLLAEESRRHRTAPGRRSAFTLVEVLLAIGLCALLMVGILGALELYRQISTAGRTDIERAQVARAALRKIELDIRSVVYRDPALASSGGRAADEAAGSAVTFADEAAGETSAGASGSGSGGSGGTGEGTIAGEVDTAGSFAGSSVGVVGDATSLVLHISRPARTLNYGTVITASGAAASRTSDLQSVSYFIASAGGGGLQGAVGNVAAGGSARAAMNHGTQGLARLEGDRLAMDLADSQGDTESLAAGAQILAEEITYLQFRYYDGVQWWDTWDSELDGRLPQAIEVTLGFGTFEESEPGATAPASSSDLWRLVVPLPLSPPYAEEVGL